MQTLYRHIFLFSLTCSCLFIMAGFIPKNPGKPPMVDVFVSGEEGYASFRIPAILTTNKGTILAFCEGREIASDHAQNDIVLKRSTDGGKTWGALQVIAEEGKNSLNNPQVVEVQETGRILLMYQRFPRGIHEHDVVPGYEGDNICRSYIMYSDDEGKTWSAPREITTQVKRPTFVTSVASGPGIGIQLKKGVHKGRVVMPFNQGPFGKWKVYAVYSDDQGNSWQYGEVAFNDSEGIGNEVQMVELGDGAVMLNSRSYEGNQCRKIAVSYDGGENWTGLINDSTLVEPQCQATILRYSFPDDGKKSRILFANPASREHRKNGTVWISYDEGKTWPVRKTVYAGGYAYSCLTKLPDDNIGLLFERDDYRYITFTAFDLDWIENNP